LRQGRKAGKGGKRREGQRRGRKGVPLLLTYTSEAKSCVNPWSGGE